MISGESTSSKCPIGSTNISGEWNDSPLMKFHFIGTHLEEYLKQHTIGNVVITGLTTPHCVSTTSRMSGNLGFNTYLISDSTAAFGLTDQHT